MCVLRPDVLGALAQHKLVHIERAADGGVGDPGRAQAQVVRASELVIEVQTLVPPDREIIVSGSGGKLARGCTTTAPGKVITVPAGMNGEHDWQGLTTCVRRVKEQFADETRVTLSADPEVPYEHLIAAMDAVRGENEELFPDVLLSAGIR